MKLAIVGTRTFNDYDLMCKKLDDVKDQVTLVISGGRSKNEFEKVGADTLAIRWAEENQKQWIEFLPDWDKHGKAAGPIRNEFIVKACTHIVLFWDGKSLVTRSSLELAKKHKKRYRLIQY